SHRWPWFLPDGKHFLYFGVVNGINHGSIHLGSLDSAEATTLAEADSNAVYARGYLLFLRSGVLIAQPFDLKSMKLTADPIPAAGQVQNSVHYAAFSVSAGGELVYAGGSAQPPHLAWLDRGGKQIESVGEPAQLSRVSFSPDRKNVAVSI